MEQENSSASTDQENTLGHPLSKIRLNYAISQRSRFSRILFYVTASYGCYGLAGYSCDRIRFTCLRPANTVTTAEYSDYGRL